MDIVEQLCSRPDERPSASLQVVDLAAASARLFSEPYPSNNGHRGMVVARHDLTTSILFAMQAEAQLSQHRAEGGVTVQVLRGQLHAVVDGEQRELRPGQLLVVAPGLAHSIRAVMPSELLLTVHPATVVVDDPRSAPVEATAIPLFGNDSGTTGPVLVATTGKSGRNG